MLEIPVETWAARKSSLSSRSSAVRLFVPPRRTSEPVRAARPSLPAGSSQLPTRTVIAMLTSGRARSSAMKKTMPFFSTTRWSRADGGS
ncbi:MAG: hypothetical protein A2V74_03160 [Acidobacteria bacterium RBG_16_70_10]|nr:MAG: hypothetical protein A2V74_03160 [Acidobacteria bacterium RBG_16_70_10]